MRFKLMLLVILSMIKLPTHNVGEERNNNLPEETYNIYHIENASAHQKKIYTHYNAVKLKDTPQYRLKLLQKTDSRTGIRVVTDQFGDDRYCIALGGYWANMETGRLVDVYMENGNIIKCITCDCKKWIDTKNGEGKYGRIANDLIEFYVDCTWRAPVDYYFDNGKAIPLMYPAGDVSTVAPELQGAIHYLKVYNIYLNGFEPQEEK